MHSLTTTKKHHRIAPRPKFTSIQIKVDPAGADPQDPVSVQVASSASLTLTWSASHASAVNIDPLGSGLPASGSQEIPTAEQTYSLVAIGTDSVTQSKAETVHVFVHDDNEMVSPHMSVLTDEPSIISFTAVDKSGAAITGATDGDTITLVAVIGGEPDAVKLGDADAMLMSNSEGHTEASAEVTIDSSMSGTFACEVTYRGEVTDTGSLALTLGFAQSSAADAGPAAQAGAVPEKHIFDATALTWWKDGLCNLAASTPEASRTKNLSLAFGLRMYKELLRWELKEESPGSGTFKGCTYSVDPLPGGGLPPAYQILRKDFMKVDVVTDKKKNKKSKLNHSEWPADFNNLPADVETVTIAGSPYKHVRVFGIWWVLSGATNCSNSQIAALFSAQPDAKLYVRKKAGADPVVYDLLSDDGSFSTTDVNSGKEASYSAQRIFENSFVQVNQWKVGGVTAFTDSGKGPYQAFQLLGIGTYLGSGELTSDEADLRRGRLGDHCSSKGHAFMVGDVVYKVQFQGTGGSAQVLQSSLAKGDGELLATGDIDYQAKSLNAADCDALIANEKAFLDKVDAFLAVKPGDVLPFDPQKRKVKSLKLDHIVQFSANTRLISGVTTVCGTFYKDDGTEDATTKAHTKEHARINGVSRTKGATPGGKSKVVFGRFYAHAGS